MKLKKVEINGFRSIEEMEIEFENGCGHKILVGKNESGKSNILKALSLLSSETNFTIQDKKESYTGESYIEFIFDLEKPEIQECAKRFLNLFTHSSSEDLTEKLDPTSFFAEYCREILYIVSPDDDNEWLLWDLEEGSKIKPGWYSITGNPWHTGNHDLAGTYIHESGIQKFRADQQKLLRPLLSQVESIEDIYEKLEEIVIDVLHPSTGKISLINWKYNEEKHNLPNLVHRDSFAADPNTCIPLKNMFLLSGYQEDSIGQRINEAVGVNSRNRILNLLNNVSKKANERIQNTWKEYKNVRIALRSDGENIAIGVEDSENSLDFKERSDGFRRMVCFLLLNNENVYKATEGSKIILIDEPEVGLHHSSAKNLRDRLMELGKDHIVVYATHSISMIDTENIEKNLIVTKTDENSTYEPAKEDGTSPAENVYRAIGYSIYEELKPITIIVEGYSDKKVLSFFMKGKQWKDCSICHTRGTPNIKNVISIVDLVDRTYFLISDSDEAALSKRKEMCNPEWWFTYKDLESDAITIEDFYNLEFLQPIVEEVFKNNGIEMSESFSIPEADRMKYIKDFLQKQGEQNNIRAILGDIKNKCRSIKKENTNQDKINAVLNKFAKKTGIRP